MRSDGAVRQVRAGGVVFACVEHGTGRPVVVLHGAGVDHREAEACFEPALDGAARLHALPHEQPDLLRALLTQWLTRVERGIASVRSPAGPRSSA